MARVAVQTVAPGLSPTRMVREVGAELSRLGTHGRAELAQALFFPEQRLRPLRAGAGHAAADAQHMQQARGRTM